MTRSRSSSLMSLDPTAVASAASDEDYEEEKSPPPAPSMAQVDEEERKQRLAKLDVLLAKSTTYSKIMLDRMEGQNKERLKRQQEQQEDGKRNASGKRKPEGDNSPRKKRVKTESDDKKADEQTAETKDPSKEQDVVYVTQPALITGATLRPYQLAGVQWLASLYENGLNGILADEMGLGKTLQTISFIAYLRERGVLDPFLVVSPLSVLHNWESEFKKFAPTIPTCVYHGNPTERKELVKTRMAQPWDNSPPIKAKSSKKPKKGRGSTSASTTSPSPSQLKADFPIVLTTYEMIIRDRNVLGKFNWCFVIVDEGHRLKNMNSRLIREIRTYPSANRLILTGTPLHNNLAELWSLLNFVLPNIFDDLTSFQEWFSEATNSHVTKTDAMQMDEDSPEGASSGISTEESHKLISTLHGILRPFLLRRLKSDVETNLPPKKEYVLYAPMTKEQLDIYQCTAKGGRHLREWMVSKLLNVKPEDLDNQTKRALRDRQGVEVMSEPDDGEGRTRTIAKSRKRRNTGKILEYNDDTEDEDSDLDSDEQDAIRSRRELKNVAHPAEKSASQAAQEYAIQKAFKIVNNMHLQNKIMQMRKVCSHPFLFNWPIDPETGSPTISTDLVNASGKMLLLNRLLTALFARKHKVLIFSQFTSMLDIIEDWAREYKQWDLFRIDGSTSPQERRDQMDQFNKGGDGDDACRLFLLSTRAGGLGVNLVAADTVIFYDQDWNPQMDLQAQDRAHRIGQTRPVLIFRLIAEHTVETHILDRATQKRKLEALVIAKGKFKQVGSRGPTKHDASLFDTSSLMLEGEKIDVVSSSDDKIISDEDLDVLLDRSPEVFTGRGVGWSQRKAGTASTKDGKAARKDTERKLAFQVFQRRADDADGLANMLDEE